MKESTLGYCSRFLNKPIGLIKHLLLMGILSSIFGCRPSENIIDLTSNQDAGEGWRDMIFTITQREKMNNGFWSLVCKAKYENEIVGLKINIADGIPPGIVNEEIDISSFRPNGVEIESIGNESDRLIEVISKIYEQQKRTKFTNDKLICTVFPLNNKQTILETDRFQFKLFFDENSEQKLYAELFLLN
ncbi:MAG: hypothetical protein ACFCUU_15005 [Cyclobacteriaceae bacterium]